MKPGTLFLIPVPLGAITPETLSLVMPAEVLSVARRINHYAAESAKTARNVLKLYGHPLPIRDIVINELNEHTHASALSDFLTILKNGHDLGLMSEAGCPAVADPGSNLVKLAHQHGVRVIPLTGPSSILLALMASGMNGQHFTFHGYLPIREPERHQSLTKIEADSHRAKSVEIFIETPYRNIAMLEACIKLGTNTRLCVACDLTLPSEWIRSGPISEWRRQPNTEDISRRPAVFLIQAS